MDKATLRHELKQKLMQISRHERIDKSKDICDLIVKSDVFHESAVVMVFLSLPHEVDTTPLILHAWQQGKTVAVPKVSWEQRHMIPVEINSLDTGLKEDRMGVRNPTAGIPVEFEEIDMVVTPGLGFDKLGNRLGRGGAYYDNFFAHERVAAARWGVGFDEQICEQIPHDESDIPVQAVVTENGIIDCENS
ncbi:MAG: 5-formyltetrahydrofolate cyclo-ligase [Planctomycetota bacterium]|jgi:5-formyltetrahydrofolate cyclo-ligase